MSRELDRALLRTTRMMLSRRADLRRMRKRRSITRRPLELFLLAQMDRYRRSR